MKQCFVSFGGVVMSVGSSYADTAKIDGRDPSATESRGHGGARLHLVVEEPDGRRTIAVVNRKYTTNICRKEVSESQTNCPCKICMDTSPLFQSGPRFGVTVSVFVANSSATWFRFSQLWNLVAQSLVPPYSGWVCWEARECLGHVSGSLL